ncbi:Mur ligase domain-containing protein, partial [Nocardioides sp.]|uniref:Mur ligase domain-containing protein n=1 Tax=Nocardioides sp. TaxID=35761 RepID=UPI0025DC3D91
MSDATRPEHPPRTALTVLARWLGGGTADGSVLRGGAGDPGEVEITGISLSSQRIRPGDLYAALPGSRVHGIEYAEAALAAGAVAILTDPVGAERGPAGAPYLVVDEPRARLGRLSA